MAGISTWPSKRQGFITSFYPTLCMLTATGCRQMCWTSSENVVTKLRSLGTQESKAVRINEEGFLEAAFDARSEGAAGGFLVGNSLSSVSAKGLSFEQKFDSPIA
jgi:hypothetical protein